MNKGKIPVERRFFLNNTELFLNAREKKLLITLKVEYYQWKI